VGRPSSWAPTTTSPSRSRLRSCWHACGPCCARARPADPGRALAGGESPSIPPRHRVTVAGAQVELTPKEFDLLHALMASAGRVLSREHLLKSRLGLRARGRDRGRAPWTVHVRRLRAKASGDAGRRIATVKSGRLPLRVGVKPGARGYSKRYETCWRQCLAGLLAGGAMTVPLGRPRPSARWTR